MTRREQYSFSYNTIYSITFAWNAAYAAEGTQHIVILYTKIMYATYSNTLYENYVRLSLERGV